MKGYRFHRLIALLVMAALIASMAALVATAEDALTLGFEAGAEINDGAAAAVKDSGEPDLFSLEAQKEQPKGSIELLSDDGIMGQTQIPPVEGKSSADSANGSALSVRPGKLTVPVSGYAAAKVKYTGNSTISYKLEGADVVKVFFGGSWIKDKMDIYVFGLKKGKATLTFTESSSGKTAVIKVTVQEVKGYKTLYADPSVTVRAGDTATCDVVYTLPVGSVKLKVKGEDVVSAGFGNWNGAHIPLYVTGLKKGSATITISNDQNGDKVVVKVKVTKGSSMTYKGQGKQDGKQKCRALVIGISDLNPVTRSTVAGADQFADMLKTVKGPKGRAWSVTEKTNLTKAGVRTAIHDAFADADEDDLSLWYIGTRGDYASTDENAGQMGLAGYNTLRMSELAELLGKVPGKVIVVIDAGGSGAGLYDEKTPTEPNAALNAFRRSTEAFNGAAIDAFAAANTCVEDAVLRTTAVKGEDAANMGELRVPDKFYVLTAARRFEFALGSENKLELYFTKWLVKGVGRKGRMPADKNRDGVATLRELYRYIARNMDDDGHVVEGITYYQHVQMYPKNSEFKVFKRK